MQQEQRQATVRERTPLRRARLASTALALVLGIALAASLSGCIFDKSPDELEKQITSGEATQALNSIEDQLRKQPGSPVYQVLALHARLVRCAELNCPTNRPAEMQAIAGLLRNLRGPVSVSEKLTLNPLTLVAEAAPAYARLPEQPAPLLALLAAVPDADRATVLDALFTQPLDHLRSGNTAAALAVLQSISRSNTLAPLYRQWSGAMAGLLARSPEAAQSNLLGLRNEGTTSLPPQTGLQLVPHVIFLGSPSGTLATIQGFSPTITGWQLPTNLLGPEKQRTIAAELNRLRSNERFLTRALANFTPPEVTTADVSGTQPAAAFVGTGTVVTMLSPTVPLTDPGVALQLHLASLSLQLDPAQQQLWREFLPLASRYAERTGDTSLFAGLSLTGLPSAQQQQVVADLFKLIQKQATAGQPILPLLQQLGQLQLDRPSATRLEKLVQTGLENAIASRNLDEVLAYARFKPNLAQANRASIAPLVVGTLREQLQQNNFDAAVDLASLLNDTLHIDVDLDAVLTQEFQAEVERTKVVESLSADTPGWLQQPAGTITLDLGPLWGFMQTYFADQPKVLNDTLRNLVASARGGWGVPTAMARLNSLFDDSEFPADARRSYLVNAITTSLVDDATLSPERRLAIAASLKIQYPELALAPVVEAALRSSQTLEDSRALWQGAAQPVRQVITAVRPQFAALMRGVDAWQSGDRNAAARAFATITDAVYADQLSPYLMEIGNQLNSVAGLYANTGANTGAGNALPTLAIRVSVPAFAGSGSGNTANGTQTTSPSTPRGNTLTQLDLSVLNRLGTLTTTAPASGPNPLATSYATLRQAGLPVTLNLNRMDATISPLALQRAAAPSPFETTFGDLRTLTFTSTSLVVTTGTSPEPVRLTRLLVSADAPLWPYGRYSLTAPLTAVGTGGVNVSLPTSSTSALNTALQNTLPPGSLLTLSPATDSYGQPAAAGADGTIPVQGELWHPGLSQPQTVSGTFSPATLATDLTWQAPLGQPGVSNGGTAKVIARCQTVPGRITCGAYYAHMGRQQYIWRITGTQTAESLAATRTQLSQRNTQLIADQPAPTTLLNRLSTMPLQFVSRTIPTGTTAGTGTGSSITTPTTATVSTTAVSTSATGPVTSAATGAAVSRTTPPPSTPLTTLPNRPADPRVSAARTAAMRANVQPALQPTSQARALQPAANPALLPAPAFDDEPAPSTKSSSATVLGR